MPSKVRTEFVDLPSDVKIDHPLTILNENYVLYASSIGVQYVFEKEIDIDLFKKAVAQLLIEYPGLSGVANFTTWEIDRSEKGVPIQIEKNIPGYAAEHGTIGKIQHNRTEYVFEPARKLIEKGQANLFAIKISYFMNGGCILGLTVNHAIGDATGHHLIAHRLSDIFISIVSDKPVTGSPLHSHVHDIFTFGSDRSQKQTLADLKSYGTSKPLKVKGFPGIIFKKLIAGGLNRAKDSLRVLVHFDKDHLVRLKKEIKQESGLEWLSTNIAVGAHLSTVMSRIQIGKKKAPVVQLTNLFNMRNRYFKPDDPRQKNYAGNAMYIHTAKTNFAEGFQNVNRGKIARFLKDEFDKVDAVLVKRDMDLVVDCLRHGYTYPGLDMMKPLIGINNQSKLDVYGVDFGAGELLRVIPQDVGDNILMFPDKDGGMEIYLRHSLSPGKTKALLDEEMQKKLYRI